MSDAACRCDCRKCAAAVVVATVLRGGLSYLIHEVILGPRYQHYSALFQVGLMKARAPFFALAHLAWAAAFACMYAHGHEAGRGAVGQGLRFGVWAWLIGTVSPAINPLSGRLIGAWMGLELLECLAIGAVVASVYKPTQTAA